MRSPRGATGLGFDVMNAPAHPLFRSPSVRVRWFMAIAWIAILIKCVLVTWAVDRWHMPFHAAWVVAPTLAFAALATGLWLVHRE